MYSRVFYRPVKRPRMAFKRRHSTRCDDTEDDRIGGDDDANDADDADDLR